MKLHLLWAAAFVAMTSNCTFAEEPAQAGEEKVFTAEASVDVLNQYMFRGLRLYNGTSIEPSVTGTVNTEVGSFSANLWMHLTGDTSRRDERFTELDETISWEKTFGDVTLSLGNAWYSYSDLGDGSDIEDSAEVFAIVSLDAPLAPTFSVYHDWRTTHAQYYELGFSHELTDLAGAGASLTPFVAIGFASNSEDVYAEDGLEQITVGASTDLAYGNYTITPSMNYSFKVDDNTVNQLWFGISIG